MNLTNIYEFDFQSYKIDRLSIYIYTTSQLSKIAVKIKINS